MQVRAVSSTIGSDRQPLTRRGSRSCIVSARAGRFIAAIGLCSMTGVAAAQPSFFEIFESRFHAQVSADQPVDVAGFAGYLRITGSDLSAFFDSAAILAPSGEEFTLEFLGGTPIAFVSGADQSEIDFRLPGGAYTYTTTGGLLDDQSGELVHPVENYFPYTIPYVTNWDELQGGLNPASDFTVGVAAWSGDPGLAVAVTFISVRRESDDGGVMFTAFDAAQDSFVIAGNTLEANTRYIINIAYSARFYTPTSAWGGTIEASAFDLVTELAFTTGTAACSECPSDFNCDGGVDGADIGAFFEAWEAGDSTGDLNQDGGVDGSDVDSFFERWEAGC